MTGHYDTTNREIWKEQRDRDARAARLRTQSQPIAAPIDPRHDFNLLIALYEIIKRYELLVQYMLDTPRELPTSADALNVLVKRMKKQIADRAYEEAGSGERAAQQLGVTPKTFLSWQHEKSYENKPKPEPEYQTT